MGLRINVGCGLTPTPGWRNFDNSLSLRISRIAFLPDLMLRVGLLDRAQYQFVRFASENEIEYADAARKLPLVDGSVEVLYSSHMLEHLDREGADRFLSEAKRVMAPGAIIRIAVPDLSRQVAEYCASGDADSFIAATLLTEAQPKSFMQRVKAAFVGSRNHQWMYDGLSLMRLLDRHGFANIAETAAGKTRIADPGSLNLEERSADSVYVEAEKPAPPTANSSTA